MTAQPQNFAPPRTLSKSSLCSLICGILGCVPFITGGLAILLGIVGFIRTGNPEKKGRWMAIVGLLLGLASIGGWAVFGSAALLLWKGTEGPRVATHDFLKALEDKNRTAEKATSELNDDDLDRMEGQVAAHGKFIDTTFNNTSITNSNAEVAGTAKFDSGTYQIEASLLNSSSWKVTRIYLHPDKNP